MSRQKFYESIFSAKALFITGLVIMPALLFNPNTEYRCLQFLFFWMLVWLSGKKMNFLSTIIIITVIIAFNLLIPYGRVLFSIGPFRITSGALQAGIHRAVTLEALIMLSRVTISQDLKIPGAFGELLGESLRIFSVLMSGKKRLAAKNYGIGFIAKLDQLMLEYSMDDFILPDTPQNKTKPAGYIILAAAAVLSWLPLILYGAKFYG